MTKEQALKYFVEAYSYESVNVLKARIKDGVLSKTTLRCEFLDFTNYLREDGQITERQQNNWTCPNWLY